jgi:hypothetical protein
MSVFLSPEEIADDLMLYRMSTLALTVMRRHSLEETLSLVNSDIGHSIRAAYELWNEENPYTAGSFDPNAHVTLDGNPKHPHNVTRQILTIVWKRLQ